MIFIINIFFAPAIPVSLAAIKIQPKLFDFSENTNNPPVNQAVPPTGERIGYVDTSEENKVKVCKDITCADPVPGIIDFKISGDSPLLIDSQNGLSGKVWGNELGWIIFNPPYGGVFFADATTGLLKGTAWSEASGVINFAVTGQKVVINPDTGEWSGWVWASGPYGGWIKFDCRVASCVKTTWRGQTKKTEALLPPVIDTAPPPTPVSPALEARKNTPIFAKALKTAGSVLNDFSDSFVNLYDGTGQLIRGAYDSLSASFTNLGGFVSDKINKTKINGSVFAASAVNLKNFFKKMIDVEYKVFDGIGQAAEEAHDFVQHRVLDTWVLGAFDAAGQAVSNAYSFMYSGIMDLRAFILQE